MPCIVQHLAYSAGLLRLAVEGSNCSQHNIGCAMQQDAVKESSPSWHYKSYNLADCYRDLSLSLASPSFSQVAKLERPNIDGISRSVMSAGHSHCCMNPYNVYLRTEPPASSVVCRIRVSVRSACASSHSRIDNLMQARVHCESEGEATC